MANEISISAILEFAKNSSAKKLSINGLLATMSGDDFVSLRQVIGTSEEALNIPSDIGTPGWLLVINRDATNFVSIRRATGEGNFAKLLPGEPLLCRLAAAAPYLIADSAPVAIEYLLLEA